MRLRLAGITRPIVLAVLAVLCTAAVSHASGLNLAWNDCAGDGGASNRSFACTSNTGSNNLIASFQSSSVISEPIGVEAAIDLQSADATLPSWWTQQSQGGCRPTGSLFWSVVVPPTYQLCLTDLNDAGFLPLSGAFLAGFSAPNRCRFAMTYRLQDTTWAALPAGEIYVLTLSILNRGTVGTSCTGCSTPACLVFNSLRIHRRDGLPDVVITNPGDHPYATWQGGAIGGLGCPAATPAHNTTWGVLKSLYR